MAIYLEWLQISEDETRPFHYIFSQFFKKSASIQTQSLKELLPKIQENKKKFSDEEKIDIINITKVYDGSASKALDNLYFEFGKGEIFGLLGFNGAGKSSLINILCGVNSSTEGTIKIFGLDPEKDRLKIAQKTGLCSQKDVLFDSLSTFDHLYYYGLMNGVLKGEIDEKIRSIAEDLKISQLMLDTNSSNLSGGQKRKLGLGD